MGHLEVLQYARAHGCSWSGNVIVNAAQNGHVEAYENSCPFNDYICTRAAFAGQLNALKWAVAHGCRVTSAVSALAAETGNMEILLWLHEIGCPFGTARPAKLLARVAWTC